MEGIDVSVYQGDIDWNKIKNVDFVYIKASQGIKFYDTRCLKNATSLSKTNIKFGYYHFATLNSLDVEIDAKQEAFDFINQLKSLPKTSLSNSLDIELNDVLKLTPYKVEQWVHTFISTMLESGYSTILYSYKIFLDTYLPQNHSLGKYPLWIAQYSNNKTPILPRGWSDWVLWQYSDKGKIDGIQGNVDLNHSKILI